jgi:hypothetical protein
LWQKWLADTATAVQDLRRELSSASVPEERVEAR